MKIAVSGVGGGVGQSILKALSISSLDIEPVAIDVQPISAGLFRASSGKLLPKPETAEGLACWETFFKTAGIAALLPGSDHDLLPLASVRDRWGSEGLCQVLVSDLSLVQACRDKAASCQLLEQHGIPVPKYTHDATLEEAVSWASSIGFPVVLKPRDGFASQNVHVIADEEELRFFYARTPQPIMQEFLGTQESGSEFTCAVFVNRHGSPVGTFMARRELSGGSTHHAEIGFWPEIHELLWAIGEAIRPMGMLNVQLRSTPRGPVPFELNIRCSGTSAIRAYYGFNEPEMMIRHYLLGEELELPEVRTGYVIRYWNEMFLDGVGFEAIRNGPDGMKGTVIAWP